MPNDNAPLSLLIPVVTERRSEGSQRPQISLELLNRRQEISRQLTAKIKPLSLRLNSMSEVERKAVFYKLSHEIPLNITGTGLKSITEQSEKITLAIPRDENLEKLLSKINEFGESEIVRDHVKNEQFVHLLDFEIGDSKDRLSQELFENYETLVLDDWVICEIELISLARGRLQQRDELRSIREEIDQEFSNRQHGNFFEHKDIKGTCRAVIRCTGEMFKRLVEDQKWYRSISWFDVKPKFETYNTILKDFSFSSLEPISNPPEDNPVICIIDTGLTQGNPFLEPVSKEDLIQSFLKHKLDNPSDEYNHGSGVASLVSYYALNVDEGSSNEGKLWLASARVLDENNTADEERMFSEVIEEVVNQFQPLGVRIFNLSINIVNRMWNEESKRTVNRRSWVARTIDKLSREKDIIFVISAGNLSRTLVSDYYLNGVNYPNYFHKQDSKIYDPAQSALGLTVGAIVSATTIVSPDGSSSVIADQNQPSPFTRCGPGINKEIKPELVEYGGNLIHDGNGHNIRNNLGTDVLMASNILTPALSHDLGTSFSAARTSHKLGIILSKLKELGIDNISSSLLKAFIVNSASTETIDNNSSEIKDVINSLERKYWHNIIGYGFPESNSAIECNNHSAIMYYQGKIAPNTVEFFDVPVPNVLTDTSGIKRLSVTISHLPEVQRWGLERYLATTLKWRLFRGDIDRDQIISAMSNESDQNGNRQDIPNELSGKIGIALRSRGTIQKDIFEWNRHNEEYSNSNYTLAITAFERWNRTAPPPVPYGVVIKLEETAQISNVYAEVESILDSLRVETQIE